MNYFGRVETRQAPPYDIALQSLTPLNAGRPVGVLVRFVTVYLSIVFANEFPDPIDKRRAVPVEYDVVAVCTDSQGPKTEYVLYRAACLVFVRVVGNKP